MKYIIFRRGDLIMPLIFADQLNHSDILLPSDYRVVSAGFCSVDADFDDVVVNIDENYPSVSLGIKVYNKQLDTYYLNRLLDSSPSSEFIVTGNEYKNAPRYTVKNITPENIENLEEGEVFVFGSNLRGEHIGGAARQAYDRGWIAWGIGEGMDINEKAYALPTINSAGQTFRSLGLRISFLNLLTTVFQYSEKRFLLTRVGCGIAGLTVEEVKEIFWKAVREINKGFPTNLYIPQDFIE